MGASVRGGRLGEKQILFGNDRQKSKDKNRDSSGSFVSLRMTRVVESDGRTKAKADPSLRSG
jgi:hypothetical protein